MYKQLLYTHVYVNTIFVEETTTSMETITAMNDTTEGNSLNFLVFVDAKQK